MDLIPVTIGTEVLPRDTVLVDEGAKATLMLVHSGKFELNKKTKFKVPKSEMITRDDVSLFTKVFGGIWIKTKQLFQWEIFAPTSPTDSGRRG